MRDVALETAVEIAVYDPALLRLPYWIEMGRIGVPPHITLLYPWRAAPLTDSDVEQLQAVVGEISMFTARLTDLATFEKGVVYLTPEPKEEFEDLIGLVCEKFPDTPPYKGEHGADTPVPHLTVAKCDPSDLDRTLRTYRELLEPDLPLPFEVSVFTVEQQTGPDEWKVTHELGF